MVHKKKINYIQKRTSEEQKRYDKYETKQMAVISAIWVKVLQKNRNNRNYIYKEIYKKLAHAILELRSPKICNQHKLETQESHWYRFWDEKQPNHNPRGASVSAGVRRQEKTNLCKNYFVKFIILVWVICETCWRLHKIRHWETCNQDFL